MENRLELQFPSLMKNLDISYKIPKTDQKIILNEYSIKIFFQKRQIKKRDSESGGQLFAEISTNNIIIKSVTVPDNTEKRSRYFFIPNRNKQQTEINTFFKSGLHYVGDWHTHPESTPAPSITDLTSMQECFSKSIHQLNYFLLIIIGTSFEMSNNWVGLINGKEHLLLDPDWEIC